MTTPNLTPFKYISPALHSRAYVAGGSAVPNSPYPPRDIDLWIVRGDNQSIDADRTLLFNHLEQIGQRYEHVDPEHYPWMEFVSKAAWFKAETQPYQVMLTPYKDITELLLDFDLTCHACAYDPQGNMYYSPNYTPLNEQIRVQKWTTPHSTMRRLIMMADRYRTKIHWQDAEQLAQGMIDKVAERERQRISDMLGGRTS